MAALKMSDVELKLEDEMSEENEEEESSVVDGTALGALFTSRSGARGGEQRGE